MTVVEFLLARIAEDEAMYRDVAGCYVGEAWAPFGWGHEIDLNAERGLAECEAKRRIIEWHQAWPILVDAPAGFDAYAEGLQSATLRMTRHIAWMTEQEYRDRFGSEPPTGPVLRLLALPYAGHPDYRQEWRP